MSGFLSALSSFSEEFKNLGTINEFKMSDSDLRLAFLKHHTIPNLIFLASFDKRTKGVNVQRFLRKTAYSFLKRFDITQLNNWDGNTKAFSSFAPILKRYANRITEENEIDFKEKVVELFDKIQNKIDTVAIYDKKGHMGDEESVIEIEKQTSPFQTIIPVLKIADSINPDFYLTGSNSKNVLKKIDGKKSILEISNELDLSPEKVHSICKNLIKLGFIVLKEV
ncbi:MAG: winged helix-turn-helix transcriptional regulator [Promethearchaeota archaeon]|nr:MAG: winged helix-turn-helix transcriptional regulator [Candidatus Lokiarchaeota archaeon]